MISECFVLFFTIRKQKHNNSSKFVDCWQTSWWLNTAVCILLESGKKCPQPRSLTDTTSPGPWGFDARPFACQKQHKNWKHRSERDRRFDVQLGADSLSGNVTNESTADQLGTWHSTVRNFAWFRRPFWKMPLQRKYIWNQLKSQNVEKLRVICGRHWLGWCLTHWDQDKMAAIYQTHFSNAFSGIKMYTFRLRFHWSLFPMIQLTIFQHWFR